MVGLILIGLGLGKLGFVADLLSKEVQVGYMNGLAITIVVGQLPKLCGFSTDADGFVDEVHDVLQRLRRAQLDGAGARCRHVGACCSCCPASPNDPGRPRRRGRRDRRDRRVRSRPSRTVGSLPQGLPRPALPWTDVGRRGPMLVAAIGITLGVADRHDRDVDELRRPPGRRGRPEPGDGRHRDREHRGRVLPGLRGVHQRFADGRRRAVAAPRASSPGWSAPSWSRCCCCSSAPCSPIFRRLRSLRW